MVSLTITSASAWPSRSTSPVTESQVRTNRASPDASSMVTSVSSAGKASSVWPGKRMRTVLVRGVPSARSSFWACSAVQTPQ